MNKVLVIIFASFFSLTTLSSQGLIDSPGKIYSVNKFDNDELIGEVVRSANNTLDVYKFDQFDNPVKTHTIIIKSNGSREVYKYDRFMNKIRVARVEFEEPCYID